MIVLTWLAGPLVVFGQTATAAREGLEGRVTTLPRVEQAIAAEQKALAVTAAAVKTVLDDGQRDMRMCLTMLKVADQLPADQLQQLTRP